MQGYTFRELFMWKCAVLSVVGEELADVAIYLMGLSEMLGFDLEEEILKKVDKNGKRVYKNIDGVNVRVSD